MSGTHEATEEAREATTGTAAMRDGGASALGDWIGWLERDRVPIAAGVGAALAATLGTGLRVLWNLPFDPIAIQPTVRSGATTGVAVVVGLALVATALGSRRPGVRVGLLFAGVFGPMAALAHAASLPAAVAVTAGGGIAMTAGIRSPTEAAALRAVLAATLLGGLVVSLGATTGLVEGGLRPTGTALYLLGVGGLGLLAWSDRLAILAGVGAFLAFLWAASASPFAVGGTLLAVFAVATTSHLLVGVALAGAVAAGVRGVRAGRPSVLAGAVLVILAGAPTTAPSAATALLGMTLLLVEPQEPGTPSDDAAVTPEVGA